MKLSFNYTKQDYARFLKHFYSRFPGNLLPSLFTMYIIGFSFLVDTWQLQLVFIVVFLLISVVLLLIFNYLLWRLSKTKGVFGPVELTISEDGIHTKNEYSSYMRKWIGVKKIVETKKYYYLMFSRSITIVVPKRAFQSTEEMKAFKSLVEQYLGNNK